MKPLNVIFVIGFLLGVVMPGHAQVLSPAAQEFSLSKIGQEGATETEAQAQLLLGLIQETAFVTEEMEVVPLNSTPARVYYVDQVVQRVDSHRYLIEMSLRYPDGSKMANAAPRSYLLTTVREQSWRGAERPGRRIFAVKAGTETYLGMDGKTRRASVLREVTAETLGYRTILRSDLDAVTQKGHVFQVTEFVPQPKGKPALRRIWHVKW